MQSNGPTLPPDVGKRVFFFKQTTTNVTSSGFLNVVSVKIKNGDANMSLPTNRE